MLTTIRYRKNNRDLLERRIRRLQGKIVSEASFVLIAGMPKASLEKIVYSKNGKSFIKHDWKKHVGYLVYLQILFNFQKVI